MPRVLHRVAPIMACGGGHDRAKRAVAAAEMRAHDRGRAHATRLQIRRMRSTHGALHVRRRSRRSATLATRTLACIARIRATARGAARGTVRVARPARLARLRQPRARPAAGFTRAPRTRRNAAVLARRRALAESRVVAAASGRQRLRAGCQTPARAGAQSAQGRAARVAARLRLEPAAQVEHRVVAVFDAFHRG